MAALLVAATASAVAQTEAPSGAQSATGSIPFDRTTHDLAGPWASPDGSIVIALNSNSDASPSSLMALRGDGTVKWRRADLRGPVADVSFSPAGELVVIGDDRVVRDDTAWLSVMSGTNGRTVRQRDLADLTVAGTGTTDVEYGADDNVYLQIVVGNRAVIQSFRFSDLQSIDEVGSSGGYLGARQPLIAIVGPYSSVGFFRYANGGLREAVFKNASANIQSSSISPAGAVFALSNYHSACSGVEVMYVSPTTTWSRPVAQYAPDVASDCEAYDIAPLPSGGAAVLLFLPNSLRILILDESGSLVRAIARPLSRFGDDGGPSLRSVQSFELKADGKGNLLLIMEGLESGCTAELRPAPCGFIRIETMANDGTPVASEELHGDRGNSDFTDDSVRLYRPGAFGDRDIDFATGLVGLAVTRAPYYVEHGRGTGFGTETFVTVSLPVERRFWKDPPTAKAPVIPTTTSTSTSTSSTTTTIAQTSQNIRVSPTQGVQGTTFSLRYRCPTRTFPTIRISDSNNNSVSGYSLGLPTSRNGRDYTRTITAYSAGKYRATLICGGVASGLVTFTVSAAQQGVGKYVALGDSFSSGEGTFRYDANALACHRGPLAWPRQLEAASNQLGPIDHRACTGAVTRDLFAPQRGKGVAAQIPTTPQLDVGLVTITIGGNDAEFAQLLKECYQPGSCVDAPDRSDFLLRLAILTETLKRVVYPRLIRAYPNARIVHVGYPRLTPLRGATPINCLWLDPDEQDAGDRLVHRINDAIRSAVKGQSRVEYADVTDALAGHELCQVESWVNYLFLSPDDIPLTVNTNEGDTERGHPTPRGQTAYAVAVATVLGL